jgi:hypothetical protein
MLAFLYYHDTHRATIELRCSIATIIELAQTARRMASEKNLRIERYILNHEEYDRLGIWVHDRAHNDSHLYEFRAHRIMGAQYEICDCNRSICHRQEPAPDRRPPWSPIMWDLGSDDQTVGSVLRDTRTRRDLGVPGPGGSRVEDFLREIRAEKEQKSKRPPSKLHPLVKLDDELRALDTPGNPT